MNLHNAALNPLSCCLSLKNAEELTFLVNIEEAIFAFDHSKILNSNDKFSREKP